MALGRLALLLAVVSVVACSDDSDGSRDTTSPSAPVETADARPSSQPAQSTRTQGLFLIQYFSGHGEITPIDPLTGQDLPGFTPYNAGHAFDFALSPDGTAAMGMRSPTQQPQGALVHLDLANWSAREVAPTVDVWFGGAWDASGEQMYAFISGPPRRQLAVADPNTGTITRFPGFDLLTNGAVLSQDGARLYTLAYLAAQSRSNVIEGDPLLVSFDTSSGREEARVLLPGLVAGQRKEDGGYAGYLPGMVASPDGQRLYIAHAESNAMTVVDLKTMSATTHPELQARRSRWERLKSAATSWFVETAHAKGGAQVTKSLSVTNDGKYLLLTGYETVECGPERCEENRPLGLRVVDRETLRVVREIPNVSRVVQSPDGALIVGYAPWWFGDPVVDGNMTHLPVGMTVIQGDAASGPVSRIREDLAVSDVAIAPDGLHLLAISPGPGTNDAGGNQGRCAEPCEILSVFAVSGGRLIAQRELFSFRASVFGQRNDPW